MVLRRIAALARRVAWTTIAASLALAATACSGLIGLSRAENDRLAAFDFYWQRLADDYPLFGNQHVDWRELRSRYRAAVPFAQRPHEFYHLLSGMLSELGDMHVSLAVPPENFAQDGIAATSLLDSPGFRVMPVEGRLHVVDWPASAAPHLPDGVPAGAVYPEIVRVNGFPVVIPLVDNLMLGPPDSPVELQLLWRNGSVTRHVMRRPAATTPVRATVLAHLEADEFRWRLCASEPLPWIELLRLDDEESIAAVEGAIERTRSPAGLVLDLRRNLGGRFLLAKRLAEHFLREPIEMVVVPPHPMSTWFGLVDVEVFVSDPWLPRPPLFDSPLVVMTSAVTGSAAEHMTRILQRHAGAIVVGERTAGAEAAIQTERGPDGATLRFGSTRIVDRTGVGLQREGVVPDVAVRLTLEDLERLGVDEAVADWERRLLTAARAALARRR